MLPLCEHTNRFLITENPSTTSTLAQSFSSLNPRNFIVSRPDCCFLSYRGGRFRRSITPLIFFSLSCWLCRNPPKRLGWVLISVKSSFHFIHQLMFSDPLSLLLSPTVSIDEDTLLQLFSSTNVHHLSYTISSSFSPRFQCGQCQFFKDTFL